MHEIFLLQALFGVTIVAAEIPTGYLGDLIGRKRSLIVGSALNLLGFNSLLFAQGFWQLAIFEVTLGVGMSFISGSDISLLYDSIDSKKREGLKVIGRFQLAAVGGESVAAILGGLLAVQSFRFVIIANAVSAWVPLLLSFSLIEKREAAPSAGHSHLQNLKSVWRELFQNESQILMPLFCNFVIWSLATFIAVWMHQKYWQENGIGLAYFGWLWALSGLLVGFVGQWVHHLELRWGYRPLFFALGALPILAYLLMGVVVGTGAFVACFLFAASRGIAQFLFKDALNSRLTSTFRATANSIQSFFFRLSFAVVGPMVGWSMDHWGLANTSLILGAIYMLIFVVILVPFVRRWQKFERHEAATIKG